MSKDGDSGPGSCHRTGYTDLSDDLFLWLLSSGVENTNMKSWGTEPNAVIGQLSYQTGN